MESVDIYIYVLYILTFEVDDKNEHFVVFFSFQNKFEVIDSTIKHIYTFCFI